MRNLVLLVASVATLAVPAPGADPLTPVPIRDVRIDDAFWSPKRAVWRTTTANDCLTKFERDGAFTNFDKVRDGKGGDHGGPQWYDGLVYETIAGAADFLAETPDPKLEARIDAYIARIAAAADKDPAGYLNTHTQLKEPTHRWGANGGDDREQHDLYNVGCLVEAGVRYYRATGKTELLRVATQLANLMCDVMGPAPRQNIVPGHALGEAAMVELYALFRDQPGLKKRLPFAVDEARYLALAQFWVDQRGRHAGRKSFGAYGQDDKPVAEQHTMEGHAVRATLFANGLAVLAPATGRDDYRQAARKQWENMAGRRTYVTGGVGAVADDEKFGSDYELPNDGYLETCAAVGAAFFHQRMFLNAGDARYADALERVLYNGALCGVSLTGDRYFYENPLSAGPARRRWDWHPCPCCPPMFLKLMGSLPGLVYTTGRDEVFVNLYVGSSACVTVGGKPVALRQETNYPWQGKVRLTVESDAEFALNLRVPGWCQGMPDPDSLYSTAGRPASGAFTVTVNGRSESPTTDRGYAKLHRKWAKGDVVEIAMAMPATRVAAHPKVTADVGRVALVRGPLVYCLEGTDHDGRVSNLSLPDDAGLTAEHRPDLLGGVTILRAKGLARFASQNAPRPADLTAIPYYAHANRGSGALRVWVPRTPADATPAVPADVAVPTASHTNPGDSLAALNDGRLPSASDDEKIPRFTWWDHRGTSEWVQYTFDRPTRLAAASVYWWDERRVGRHCRVPASWRLVYRDAKREWVPVANPSAYGTNLDAFNRVTFDPVETTALRLEAKLQPGWSGGILEWQIGEQLTIAPDATIRVDVRRPGKPVSKYLAGACIEDVNHEIYGGLYSQMIFGESFQEPPPRTPARGFAGFGDNWRLDKGEMLGTAGDGPKLVATEVAAFADGAAGVEVFLSADATKENGVRNAGLILRVGKPGIGADNFDGYEIALDAGRKVIGVGRHRQNYSLLKDVPFDVPTDHWVALSAKLTGGTIEVSVDGKVVATATDPRPLPAGTVGLRQWRRDAKYRNLWVESGGRKVDLPFAAADDVPAVSGMWRATTTGTAVLRADVVKNAPFVGGQSQRLTFTSGAGEAGIENRGLNRRGLAFAAGKPYEGYLWLRAEKPVELAVSLEDEAGTPLAKSAVKASGDGWKRYDFTLTTTAAASAGRFAVRLSSPGTVDVGHAFLQPGEWGRFQKLPVRKDVVDGLKEQGVTVLRYGGSMVNTAAYKWKNMVGPRDRRPPYRGHWYPHSTNGWGIPDFLDLCDAAGFLAIPDFNIDETPQDLADFVEYANGPADSPWGRKRAAAGHPAPYKLRHIQLGNEEKVDAVYVAKFEKLARAIWAKDADIILVIGDFQYDRPITDPAKVSGSASGVTSLDGHRRILELAKQAGREVWFDVHVWTDGPGLSPSAKALLTCIDALDKLANGAKHRVVVFEFNANNHDQRRALANAAIVGRLIRDGRVPVGLSANALQPDGQNDNGWDQGLLFLNPVKTWLQPPGYVTRMVARGHLPQTADVSVDGDGLEVTATCSEDGKQVVLLVVNAGDKPTQARLQIDGLEPTRPKASVEELSGQLTDKNTAAAPTRIAPRTFDWTHGLPGGPADYTFPARSFTVIRFK
ncbi:beta-L-arabinofuranosidase domain-containing protein [Limnoglobus roseus]|uniref:non-reducing end alpha-L-arabinofuranosidase n=1 Tax=Limnoglobus roseus TaxID=2598579 RepID=A0A5C1A740_9BACT|nr:beta-L-arabinofuranosidase domain-containing protein [Limnoglobus roseus]QEL15079.1 retaining beta-L-arabinofuranosidase [Limnoglobus roseus]